MQANAPSPACQNYTGYLVTLAASRSYEELTVGVLPCFWVDWEVGCTIKPRAASPNPYAPRIETYADAGFGEATDWARALLMRRQKLPPPIALRAAMAHAFRMATRFERMFWDSAYRRESWPILRKWPLKRTTHRF